MRFRSIYGALSAILILLSACTMPLSATPPAPNLAATITAQARALQALHSATPPSVPVTGGTPTPAAVQVSVTAPTNCRSGPSTDYSLVFLVNPGMNYQAVGKYTPGNYWIIVNPVGGTCWLWGQYAVVTGNVGSLPEYALPALISVTATPIPATGTSAATAAPSATGSVPAAPTMTITPTPGPTHVPPPAPAPPTALTGSRTCTVGSDGTTAIWIEVATLTWHDTSRETGYRVYEDNVAISSIAQNSTSYQIQLRYDQGTSGTPSDTFGVEAYNTGGTSSRPSVDIPRCP